MKLYAIEPLNFPLNNTILCNFAVYPLFCHGCCLAQLKFRKTIYILGLVQFV